MTHIVGKVYALTQANFNKVLRELEAQTSEIEALREERILFSEILNALKCHQPNGLCACCAANAAAGRKVVLASVAKKGK